MALGARALAAVTLAALAVACADLTRPDAQARPDPTVAVATKASASTDRVAAVEPAHHADAAKLDTYPLVAAPGMVKNVLPSPTNPAPAAAAGGGGG